MISALFLHEQHHIEIYNKFSASVDIEGVGSDCDENVAKRDAINSFQKNLTHEFNTRCKAIESANRQYDADTDHGVNDGVFLPQI